MGSVLVIGGSSGLGLAIAKRFAGDGDEVYVTGRTDPEEQGLNFHELELSDSFGAGWRSTALLDRLPAIDTLVIAAGFYQEGELHELSDQDIYEMSSVGLVAPALLLKRLLERDKLQNLIVITSTSQRAPRRLEPMYTAVKAGLAALARSVSLSDRVEHTLVVAPAGMKTSFWKGQRPTTDMLDPEWVVDRIMEESAKTGQFREVKILRGDPWRVELVTDKPSING